MDGELLRFLGSLAAVAALVGIAHLLGFSRKGRLADEEEVREQLRLAPGGFEPAQVLLDESGEAVLAIDVEGRAMALVPHGQRHVALPVAHIECDKRRVTIVTRAPGRQALTIVSPTTVPDWVARLADAR